MGNPEMPARARWGYQGYAPATGLCVHLHWPVGMCSRGLGLSLQTLNRPHISSLSGDSWVNTLVHPLGTSSLILTNLYCLAFTMIDAPERKESWQVPWGVHCHGHKLWNIHQRPPDSEKNLCCPICLDLAQLHSPSSTCRHLSYLWNLPGSEDVHLQMGDMLFLL